MGATSIPVLAASLVISTLAYGGDPREYSKNFTLAVNPKPLPAGSVFWDRKEASSKTIDLAAALATMKLKFTPTFTATGIDDIQKGDETVSLRPKPSAGTIFAQIITGGAFGCATFLALGAFSIYHGAWRFYIGYPLATAIGVRLVVCRKNWRANFMAALVGAYLGIPASWGLFSFGINVLQLGHGSEWLILPTIFLPASILSTILLDLSLEYKNPPAKLTSFLNVGDGGIRLDFPAVQVLPEHGKTKSWRWTVALASIEL